MTDYVSRLRGALREIALTFERMADEPNAGMFDRAWLNQHAASLRSLADEKDHNG